MGLFDAEMALSTTTLHGLRVLVFLALKVGDLFRVFACGGEGFVDSL